MMQDGKLHNTAIVQPSSCLIQQPAQVKPQTNKFNMSNTKAESYTSRAQLEKILCNSDATHFVMQLTTPTMYAAFSRLHNQE